MAGTSSLSLDQRRKALSNLAGIEGNVDIGAGPRSPGRPSLTEMQKALNDILKKQTKELRKVAQMTFVSGYTVEHVAAKLDRHPDDIRKEMAKLVRLIEEELHRISRRLA